MERYSQYAYKLARILDFEPFQAKCAFPMGVALAKQGEWLSAYEYFEEAEGKTKGLYIRRKEILDWIELSYERMMRAERFSDPGGENGENGSQTSDYSTQALEQQNRATEEEPAHRAEDPERSDRLPRNDPPSDLPSTTTASSTARQPLRPPPRQRPVPAAIILSSNPIPPGIRSPRLFTPGPSGSPPPSEISPNLRNNLPPSTPRGHGHAPGSSSSLSLMALPDARFSPVSELALDERSEGGPPSSEATGGADVQDAGQPETASSNSPVGGEQYHYASLTPQNISALAQEFRRNSSIDLTPISARIQELRRTSGIDLTPIEQSTSGGSESPSPAGVQDDDFPDPPSPSERQPSPPPPVSPQSLLVRQQQYEALAQRHRRESEMTEAAIQHVKAVASPVARSARSATSAKGAIPPWGRASSAGTARPPGSGRPVSADAMGRERMFPSSRAMSAGVDGRQRPRPVTGASAGTSSVKGLQRIRWGDGWMSEVGRREKPEELDVKDDQKKTDSGAEDSEDKNESGENEEKFHDAVEGEEEEDKDDPEGGELEDNEEQNVEDDDDAGGSENDQEGEDKDGEAGSSEDEEESDANEAATATTTTNLLYQLRRISQT
ncbi:MAG: hypothetical protein Q9181_007850 [Wetmoreana brouardii]